MPDAEILLTEDDDEDAELAVIAMQAGGMQPIVARVKDGDAALEYLRNSLAALSCKPPPRVVLLDLKLPRFNGFDVLAERRKDPRLLLIPVVVLTSSADAHDVTRCYQLGANSYVVKPVPFQEFSKTITRVVAYWLEVNVYLRSHAG